MTAQYFQSIQPFLRPMNRFVMPLGIGTGLMIPLSVGVVCGWQPSAAIAQVDPPPLLMAQTSDLQVTSILNVNPVGGNDQTADGSERSPFKTITRAMDVASPNTVIQLAPGTYSASTGETFPIALKPRVTLQGNPETRGQEVVIRGGGEFSSPSLGQQNITILAGANYASLIGVTVTNPNPNGVGIQIESSSPTILNNSLLNNGRSGIVLVGNSASVIRNNFFYQNAATGIHIQNAARPAVQGNIFEQSEIGILVDHAAAPSITENRITQNKTGISVQGQAQPKLQGNSVEGNEQFGLLAIAPARPDLKTSSNENTNFFRNNGQKDIVLPETMSQVEPDAPKPTPKSIPAAPTNPTPEITKDIVDHSASGNPGKSVQATDAVAQESVPSPPLAKPNPGSVVVPVVTIPASQSVPPEATSDRFPVPPAAVPAAPAIAPVQPAVEPKVMPPTSNPAPQANRQASNASSAGLTSSAFPVPSALSNSTSNSAMTRPMQVIQLGTPLTEASVEQFGSSSSSEEALATVTIPASTPKANTVRSALATNASSNPANVSRPAAATNQRITKQPPVIPAIADEIPAPPKFAPRPAVVPQPIPASRLPIVSAPTTTVPVAGAVRPPTVSRPIPIPVPQAIPIPVPQVKPVPVAQPLAAPGVAPVINAPQRSIVIPVPRPDSDRVAPIPVKPPQLTPSPVAPLPMASKPALAKPGNLLPVPSASIPVGNIGDMPSVYSARGNRQTIPGFPVNPATAGSVVVKYRVVVVATDNTQQEQVRSIIPDAFPVVYRGQRVWQAGAFGDRAKADQLVASLNTQGLQAIIEPLE